MSASAYAHLGRQSTVGDILRHPAFAGFSRLILPWDERAYDESLPLTEIGSLLPYHTHVDPGTVASALNRMIDDVSSGRTVFYRFYSEAQIEEQPARKETGLFFFRGRPGASFAVIAPGRRVLLCRFCPRRLSLCGGDQRKGIQRFRAEVPGRVWRQGRDRRPGGCRVLHLSQRSGTWR